MEKYKVLIIEDKQEHYIEIQDKLVSDKGLSRLPYNLEVSDSHNSMRRQFLREFYANLEDKISADECMSEFEITFTNLLRQEGSLNEAIQQIDQIIRDNYRELRMIICDLELCTEPEAGVNIIRHIRNDKILEDYYFWYQKKIPIIILTGLDGYNPIDATNVGGWNCRLFKKVDLLATHEPISHNENDACGNNSIGSCQSIFQSIVDMLATEFEQTYQHYMNLKEYEIAISCSGLNDIIQNNLIPHKEFLSIFANCLYSFFTEKKVFFYGDNYRITNFKADIDHIYGRECKYVIVVITDDYNTETKKITQEEWRVIKERYEQLNWEGVFFVTIETSVANISIIKRNLGLSEDIPFIDFSELREKFYNIIKDQCVIIQDFAKDQTESDYSIFHRYKNVQDELKKEIKNRIIDAIIRKEERR